MPETIIIAEGQELSQDQLDRVGETLEIGGLIVYPTTTLYGLGALVFSEEGVARLLEVKDRPWGMPISVFTLRERISDICDIPIRGLPILDSGLPLTFILPAKPNVSSVLTNMGTLAVRFPDNDVENTIKKAFKDIGKHNSSLILNLDKLSLKYITMKNWNIWSNLKR